MARHIVSPEDQNIPVVSTRVDGDTFDRLIITGKGEIYTGNGTVRPTDGVAGTSGLDGADGASVISGNGPPNDLTDGKDGDLYIDIESADVYMYGPKIEGGWPGFPTPILSLKGPQGNQGDEGPAGPSVDLFTDIAWDVKGEIFIGTGANTADKLTVGTDGQVLTADAAEVTGVKWADPPGGGASAVATDAIFDAKGDLPVGTGANTSVRLPVGTNGHVLYADSGEASGLVWGALPSFTSQDVIDIIASALVPGTFISTIVQDAETITINAAEQIGGGGGGGLTQEDVQDIVAAMCLPGDNMNNISYSDINGTLTFNASTQTGGGGGSSNIEIKVASNDAPTAVKNTCDFVCGTTAAQSQINSAILLASALTTYGGVATAQQRGTVLLTGGRFNISGSILMRTGVTLKGMGNLTEIRSSGISASTGAGSGIGMIKYFNNDTHSIRICDMYINGNSAAGGTSCHGVYLSASNGSTGGGGVPASPDQYSIINSLYLQAFQGGNRDCIFIESTTSDNRGVRIFDIVARNGGRHAINVDGAPDGDISQIHVGTFTQDGVHIAAGNWRVAHCKAFYCDGYGFNFTNSRLTASCLEAQDDNRGFFFAGGQQTVSNIMVDTCSADGVVVNGTGLALTSASIFVRGGGRYATMTNGIRFVGSPITNINGVFITSSNITNRVSGTYTTSPSCVSMNDTTTRYVVG